MLAQTSNRTAATQSTGSRLAPKAVSGVTITLRLYLETVGRQPDWPAS
jgi:hypothetical protein